MSPRFAMFFLLVALACISLSHALIVCPADEVPKRCGTACPLRCGVPPPPQCIAKCVAGCFCKDGYWRNSANKCVLPEDC